MGHRVRLGSHRRDVRSAVARTEASRKTVNAVSDLRTRGRASALPVESLRIRLSGDPEDLAAVEAALTELDDGALWALIDSTSNITPLVPGLLNWIGHACDWELHRRGRVDFPLRSPLATIPPEEDAASIAATMTMRERFDRSGRQDVGAVVALFDAILRVLTGGDRRH